jgi:DNA-binding transcriptional LysR family regulator
VNTLYLKYAVEVASTGSITQAANNLYMAQPNISKAIKELEDSLGISIFMRTSKGVVPTEKGSEFLVYARNILSQLERMEELNTEGDFGVQSFGISIPHGSYIADGVTRFIEGLDRSKGININIQETNAVQAIKNITEDNFNLGVIRYKTSCEGYFLDYLKEKKLGYEPIWEFEYLAIMSKEHPLAGVKDLKYDEIKHYIEVVHGDNCIPYHNVNEAKKVLENSCGDKRIYVYERGSQFGILSQVQDTYMLGSPIPADLLDRYALIQRKCIGYNERYKDVLIYPENHRFTEMDKNFIEKLYASKNQVAFRDYQ